MRGKQLGKFKMIKDLLPLPLFIGGGPLKHAKPRFHSLRFHGVGGRTPFFWTLSIYKDTTTTRQNV